MSVLIAQQGPHAGRRFNLRERTRIGRAMDNDIVLSDHLVSRYHAEIIREGMHYDLRDLGSKNGLQINKEARAEHRLVRGDQIQIGATLFTFDVPLMLKSARYSNTVVQLNLRRDPSTLVLERPALPLPARTEASDLIVGLGRLFDSTAEALPEALNQMMRQIMDMFNASSGAILLRMTSGEAAPLVAFAEGDELRIGNEVLSVVLNEGKAVLTAALHKSTATDTRPRPRKAMIVPLPHQDRIFGALYVDRSGGAEYTEQDLGLLQALAHIVSGAARHALQMEQLVQTVQRRPAMPFIGNSGASEAVREQVARIGSSEATVLLTGETGTGKELVAQMIHASSPRQKEPFIAINCSAIPANLIESELFGHEAGAFTGADHMKRGKIEMAEGGTLFLDEIGEMLIDLQPKLLRFIEELTFYRVGGVRPIQSDVRIIAATNRNLETAVREGRFRQDLLFRLNVLPIHLPPLRERIEDVRQLVEYFAPPLASRLGKPFMGLIDETWTLLERYLWPGNVRELRHSLERALILSDDGILRPEHFQLKLPDAASEPSTGSRRTANTELTKPMGPVEAMVPPTMAATEAEAIRRALRYAGGNRVRAAQILDIHRNTLAKKIQEYGIEV